MSFRGFNRGRYYGRNSWRGSYRFRKPFRGRGEELCISSPTDYSLSHSLQQLIYLSGSSSNRPKTPSNESDNEDTLNESDVAELGRQISVSPASFQPRKVVTSPYAGWRLYFPDDGKFIIFGALLIPHVLMNNRIQSTKRAQKLPGK